MIFHPSINKISGYVDGVISESIRKNVQSHTEQCEKCKKEIQFLQVTEKLVEAPGEKTDSIEKKVMRIIQDRKRNISNPIVGEVKSVIGTVIIRTGTRGDDLEAFPGCALRKGDTLLTVGESKALVEWMDGSQIYINKETELNFHTSSYPLTLRLGEIFSMMQPQEEQFEIQTPSAVLSVIGTNFDTEVNKEKQTILRVLKGKVAFKNKRGGVLVKKNQQVEASEYTKPNVTQIKETQTIKQWITSVNPNIKLGGFMKKVVVTILVLIAMSIGFYLEHLRAESNSNSQLISDSSTSKFTKGAELVIPENAITKETTVTVDLETTSLIFDNDGFGRKLVITPHLMSRITVYNGAEDKQGRYLDKSTRLDMKLIPSRGQVDTIISAPRVITLENKKFSISIIRNQLSVNDQETGAHYIIEGLTNMTTDNKVNLYIKLNTW
jgi:hypothetical protein